VGERFRRGINVLAHEPSPQTTTLRRQHHPHDPACWPGGGDIHIPHATVAALDYSSPENPRRRSLNCGAHPTPASVCAASDAAEDAKAWGLNREVYVSILKE